MNLTVSVLSRHLAVWHSLHVSIGWAGRPSQQKPHFTKLAKTFLLLLMFARRFLRILNRSCCGREHQMCLARNCPSVNVIKNVCTNCRNFISSPELPPPSARRYLSLVKMQQGQRPPPPTSLLRVTSTPKCPDLHTTTILCSTLLLPPHPAPVRNQTRKTTFQRSKPTIAIATIMKSKARGTSATLPPHKKNLPTHLSSGLLHHSAAFCFRRLGF